MKNAVGFCTLLVIAVGLMSCAAADPDPVMVRETVIAEIPVTVEVTREVIQEVEVTRLVEVPVTQEVTRVVETVVTATPSPIPTQAPSQAGIDMIARNYVASQDRGGVVIEIGRALIAQKNAVPQDFSQVSLFDNKDVVAMIIFIVTNNTDVTANVYLYQGTVQVNTEQIDLFDYSLTRRYFGDDLDGVIYPGVSKIGGIWFAVGRSDLDEITQMTFRASGPRDTDFRRLGPDFEIVIDLSERVFEPLPDEFR